MSYDKKKPSRQFSGKFQLERLGFYKSKSKMTNILQIIVKRLNFKTPDSTKIKCVI